MRKSLINDSVHGVYRLFQEYLSYMVAVSFIVGGNIIPEENQLSVARQ